MKVKSRTVFLIWGLIAGVLVLGLLLYIAEPKRSPVTADGDISSTSPSLIFDQPIVSVSNYIPQTPTPGIVCTENNGRVSCEGRDTAVEIFSATRAIGGVQLTLHCECHWIEVEVKQGELLP